MKKQFEVIFTVSIPQAVGTVATFRIFWFLVGWFIVSIPQAVGTVATCGILYRTTHEVRVSIPQAVGTVATAGSRKPVFMRLQKLVLENLKP